MSALSQINFFIVNMATQGYLDCSDAIQIDVGSSVVKGMLIPQILLPTEVENAKSSIDMEGPLS